MKLRKNITTKDIACNCGCGFNKMSPALLDIIQLTRDHFNKPAHINSRNHGACRCISHNKKVGGIKTSKHLPDNITGVCRAVDMEIECVKQKDLYDFLDERFPNCLGLGLYRTFVHVDVRMSRAFRWKS